jgi:hypothetical protein
MSARPIVHAFEHPVVSSPRALAVAKFRALADALESGALDGARVEWLEGGDEMTVVELDPHADLVRLTRYRMTAPALSVVKGG